MLTARCIAPPITEDLILTWYQMAEPQTVIGEVMNYLLDFYVGRRRGPSPKFLEYCEEVMGGLAEPERTPAFHLLWAVKEITLGRMKSRRGP